MEQSTSSVYDILGAQINKINNPEEVINESLQPSILKISKQKAIILLKTKYQNIIIALGYILALHRLLNMVSSIGWGIYLLDERVIPNIMEVIITGVIIPGSIWLYSTCFDFWNFQRRKIIGLTIILVNFCLIVESVAFQLVARLLLPILLKIPVTPDITETMILTLSRCILTIILGLILYMLYRVILKNVFKESSIVSISSYKLNRHWDTRKNKWFKYDMNIVRVATTGKMHKIYENDRFLHSMYVGTTGTGKTSTCMTTTINEDFDQRVKNEDYQKRQLLKLLKKGKVRLTKDFDDINFSAYYFEPVHEKYKKNLKKIQESVMPAGITAMAPNEKFSDELYQLAKAKSIKVNRVDPMYGPDKKHKDGFIGFNPLYISPKLEGEERKLEIFSKARVYADVNQAIFEKNGGGNPYFTGLNRNITTSVTVMVLLTYPSLFKGKQPLPDVIQDIINDFSKAGTFRDEMVRQYSTKNNNGTGDPVMTVGQSQIGEYQFILDIIDYDLLGPGAKNMNEQARGLRNIINETLANPLIRKVLCAENTIDIDEILDKGEITLINYAINLGSAGTAFGLFFMLSFINAVLRRPAGKKLLPHFCFIDELPELLHPDLGRTFALFRQYSVGMHVALQSLDQFDKSSSTSYLKNVVVGGCSHQIIFGRCSAAEMKMYQELGGTREKVVETTQVSETALSMENTSLSYRTGETVETVNNVDGSGMRYRDFRDVTVFTVENGNPLLPFYGRTFFLEDIKKIERRRYRVNWHEYFIPQEGFTEKTDSLIKHSSIESKTKAYEYTRSVTAATHETIGKIDTEYQAKTAVEMQSKEVQNYDNILISAGSGDNQDEFSKTQNLETQSADVTPEEEYSFVIGDE